MCLYDIAAKYNKLLEAACAHIDGNIYDIVERGAAGQLKLDLPDQSRGCSLASTSTHKIRMGSANVLV